MLIAEIGQNYMGEMNLAKELIFLSKKGGADLAKFQLFDYEKLYPQHNIPKVELTFKEAKELFDYGASIKQEVFFSVFDVERVKWCEEIGVKRYKISSNMNDKKVLDAILKTGKPTIVSNGIYRLVPNCEYQLFCVCEYPAKKIDFDSLVCFCDEWGCPNEHYDGFSDHFVGLDVSKIALARGAKAIEKHFCINHSTGIDAEWSMDFEELVELKRWYDLCKEVL